MSSDRRLEKAHLDDIFEVGQRKKKRFMQAQNFKMTKVQRSKNSGPKYI